MRSQSRRKALRVMLVASGRSRPRLRPGFDAYGSRARRASIAMLDPPAESSRSYDFRRLSTMVCVCRPCRRRGDAGAMGGNIWATPARLTHATEALNYWPCAPAMARVDRMAMNNVTVTERAARRIGEILNREPAGAMLRVSVEGGGCSGFQYKFDTERERAYDDTVIEKSGATVLIDPVSLNYMAGSEIDFVDDLIGSSFKVNNPKATASCGCGTSFAL